eukprot:gene7378-11700_t
MFRVWLLVLLNFFVFFSIGKTEDVSSFEGFVKASEELRATLMETNQKIDYSSVHIKLFNKNGLLKDSTQCSPTGYFVLPLYDNGNYKIQVNGPEGWFFEQNEFSVSVRNGKKSPEGDVIFEFQGFSLSGEVLSKGSSDGPEGLNLNLRQQEGNELLKTTKTDSNGKFVFSKIIPGKYIVEPSNNDWKIEPKSLNVEMKTTMTMSSKFIVHGYDIQGNVVSNDLPMSDIKVFLYTNEKVDSSISCEKPKENGPIDNTKPLCFTKTNIEGKFQFKSIPVGNYYVVSTYPGFNISPERINVSVKKSTSKLSSFVVKGFVVSGSFVNIQGKGVKNVKVFVNGKDSNSVTNSKGEFTLEDMTSGTYEIEGKKDHHFFQIEKFDISPKTQKLQPIKISHYDVCGRIQVDQENQDVRGFTFHSGSNKIQKGTTDNTGRFCFKAIPSDQAYILKPIIESKEKGLKFDPAFMNVNLKDEPILDLKFEQILYEVKGAVKCLSKPCSAIISVVGNKFEEKKKFTSQNDSVNFKFASLQAGTYTVKVISETMCWKKDYFTVAVGPDIESNVDFEQKGFSIKLVASHDDISIKIEKEGSKSDLNSLQYNLYKGDNQICLEKEPGVYRIYTDSCYKFEQDVYQFDTKQPQVIILDAEKFLVKGLIKTSSENIVEVNIKKLNSIPSRGSNSLVKEDSSSIVVPAILLEKKDKINFYQYKYWASLKEEIEITPKSNTLLFFPKSIKYTLTSNECPKQLQPFDAKIGLFLKGTVKPNVEKATIIIKKDNEEILRTETDSKGQYSAGPLYDDAKFTVDCVKEGYKVLRQSPTNFFASKYSKLTVEVIDQESKILPKVFLSLSGEGFRKNSLSSEIGPTNFDKLFSGNFYLKPLLKEYIFEPQSVSITIKEGESKNIKIKGKRVAYSSFGNLKTLNAKPIEGVVVQAIGKDKKYEEGVSDSQGNYRIRGLLPGNEYEIQIKQDHTVERSSPKSVKIQVGKEDVFGHDFIIFNSKNQLSISGFINTKEKHIENVEVQLSVGIDPKSAKVIQRTSIGINKFFIFSSVQKENLNFYCQLKSKLNPIDFEFKSEAIACGPNSNVVLTFNPKLIPHTQEVSQRSFYLLLLFTVLFISMMYRNEVFELISSIQESFLGQQENQKKRK